MPLSEEDNKSGEEERERDNRLIERPCLGPRETLAAEERQRRALFPSEPQWKRKHVGDSNASCHTPAARVTAFGCLV